VKVATVRKHVHLHARSDGDLDRRIDTFTAALRTCNGVVLEIERAGRFRGHRSAVVHYEFPLRRYQAGGAVATTSARLLMAHLTMHANHVRVLRQGTHTDSD
jgi:hypothetical protein